MIEYKVASMAPENKSQHSAPTSFYFSFNPREETLAALENIAGAT